MLIFHKLNKIMKVKLNPSDSNEITSQKINNVTSP